MAAVGGFTGGERDALEVMNHESKAGNMLRGGEGAARQASALWLHDCRRSALKMREKWKK